MFDERLMLPQVLRDRATANGDRTFLRHVDGTSLSFAEMHVANLRWAAALTDVGVHEGDHVAVMLPTSFAAYHAWLGASWLRGIEVPINVAFRGRMLAYVLNDSRARVLVVSSRYLDAVRSIAPELTALELVVVVDAEDDEPVAGCDTVRAEAILAAAEPSDLDGPGQYDISTVVYTSGTTGPSKGVLVPWRCLEAFQYAMPFDHCTEDEVMYAPFPTFHASGKAPVYTMAEVGGTVVLREYFSLGDVWSDIRTHGVTRAGFVGSMPALLLAQPEQPDDADNPVRDVLMVPLIPQFKEFERRFGVRTCSGFGSTEIGMPLATGWNPPDHTSSGRPRPGFEVRLVDGHDLPVPTGAVGELIIRTEEPWLLNAGYLGKPEATASAWRNGWFHTGDAFVVDETGNYRFVDRLTDSIRRRAENISSFEVEAEVTSHPEVVECAAVAVPAEFGDDEVMVFVVARDGLTPLALIEFLIPRMAHFMVPRYLEFVDALPKTDATMKVRKVELRDRGVGENTWDREEAGVTLKRAR